MLESDKFSISSYDSQYPPPQDKVQRSCYRARFYDPISDEYFVKQSDTLAAMVTGTGDGTVPDEFEPDDVVGIDH